MRSPSLRFAALALVLIATPAAGQQKPRRELTGPDRPLAEKLRSPRDTLQTLYYAVDVYDYFPALIADAVACLDLGGAMPADSASAALLAVQLECVLKGLDVPLGSVPDAPAGEPVTFTVPGEGRNPPFPVVLCRGKDGLWRFDAKTVDAVPVMHRVTTARQKDLMADRAALRENYTDARATMKRFLG